MKFYKQTYESIFRSKRTLKKCNIDKVGAGKVISVPKYINMLSGTMFEMQRVMFDYLVKMTWLFRQFHYDSAKRNNVNLNGHELDSAFGVFMRNTVGIESRIVTMNNVFPKVVTYFDEFFPGFDDLDPFKDKLEYPFKNIGLEFLTVVYQMKERMELLEHCDKSKMGYSEFLDFVINYVFNYNDDCGYEHYTFRITRNHFQPYVKANKKI